MQNIAELQNKKLNDKASIWKDCLDIVAGYKKLNINTSEELKEYFKDKTVIKDYVKKANIIIYESVENFHNVESDELKEKYQNDAIYEQRLIMKEATLFLQNLSKPRKPISKFEKKKKVNKLIKKSKSINIKKKKKK